jgi:hypothetical protein
MNLIVLPQSMPALAGRIGCDLEAVAAQLHAAPVLAQREMEKQRSPLV